MHNFSPGTKGGARHVRTANEAVVVCIVTGKHVMHLEGSRSPTARKGPWPQVAHTRSSYERLCTVPTFTVDWLSALVDWLSALCR